MTLKTNCFNHFERESVGVCKSCNKAFCRECISFYEDKLTCSACINQRLKESKKEVLQKRHLGVLAILLISLTLGFVFFVALGYFLISLV